MDKIDFKNNQEPDLSAETLNQMQTNIENAIKSNAITVTTGANVNYTIDTAYYAIKIPLTNINYNLGSCFELVDGDIKIKKEGYYKVNANMICTGASNGSTQVIELHKNNSRIASAYQYAPTSAFISLIITPSVFYGKVGDLITMKLSSNNTNTVFTVGGGIYTYMTVEKLN